MKKIIVVSLGTIIKTDFNVAMAGFTRAAGFSSAAELQPYLPKLMPLFSGFNLGKITPETFIKSFLETLPLKTPDNFLDIWNSMCVIDDSVREIVQLLGNANEKHRYDLQFVIYSDTNPFQFDFIKNQLKNSGLDFGKMYITCQHKMPKEALLQEIMEDFKDNEFVVVLGNTDKITDETLKKMVDGKFEAISNASEKLTICRLSGPQLTQEDIENLISKHTTKPPLVFSTNTLAVVLEDEEEEEQNLEKTPPTPNKT